MPFHYSMIFQMSTAPQAGSGARVHTGSWSEGHWRTTLVPANTGVFRDLMQARARMLPKQASIVGYRIAEYEFVLNKMLPKGASAGGGVWPGSQQFECDVPQMALEMSATTTAANSTRFACKCIPDEFIVGGEYSPSTDYLIKVSTFRGELANNGWCMVGRDFTQPAYQIVSISAAGLMTLKPGAAITAELDTVRFRGVVDTLGNPISGAYELGTSPATNQWNLLGWPQGTVVGNKGTVRRDIISTFQLTSVEPTRVVVRKIGAPFEKYRGKSSRRRAA